jgi:hypothetical protein
MGVFMPYNNFYTENEMSKDRQDPVTNIALAGFSGFFGGGI